MQWSLLCSAVFPHVDLPVFVSGERERERERERETDRQTEIDRQTDRETDRQTHRKTHRQTDSQLEVCSKPSQPQGIISGLRETFINTCIVQRTNQAERPEEQSEKEESCWENLQNKIQLKGP